MRLYIRSSYTLTRISSDAGPQGMTQGFISARRRRHMNPCGGGGDSGAGGWPNRVSRRACGGPDTHIAGVSVHVAGVLERMLEACGGARRYSLHRVAAWARTHGWSLHSGECIWLQARGDGRGGGALHPAPRSHLPRSQWRHTCAMCGRVCMCMCIHTWHTRGAARCTCGARTA